MGKGGTVVHFNRAIYTDISNCSCGPCSFGPCRKCVWCGLNLATKFGITEALGIVDTAALVCCCSKLCPLEYDGRIITTRRSVNYMEWLKVVCTEGLKEGVNSVTGGGIDCIEDFGCDELCGCIDPAPYLDSSDGPIVNGVKVPMHPAKGMFNGPKLDFGGPAPPKIKQFYQFNADERKTAWANLKERSAKKKEEIEEAAKEMRKVASGVRASLSTKPKEVELSSAPPKQVMSERTPDTPNGTSLKKKLEANAEQMATMEKKMTAAKKEVAALEKEMAAVKEAAKSLGQGTKI